MSDDIPTTFDFNVHCGTSIPSAGAKRYGEYVAARFTLGEGHLAIMFPMANRDQYAKLFRDMAEAIAAIQP